MNLTKWDERFLRLAKEVSTWSKDPSTQVGAVIVDQNHIVVSLGFNGFPQDIQDDDSRLNNRELKYMMTIHAEMNALMFANKSVAGCTLYTYPFQPCSRCAACIIQSGIAKIVTVKLSKTHERWYNDFRNARSMFEEAKVVMVTKHE